MNVFRAIFAGLRGISNSKRLVFLHIPRTGGSNLWHSCAHSWAENSDSLWILDLHHESRARFGNPNHASNVISVFRKLISEDKRNLFIHHHTNFGIWRLLGTSFDYFTMLRDPVERYISNYFHSLRCYYNVTNEMQCSIKDNFYKAQIAGKAILNQKIDGADKIDLTSVIPFSQMPDESFEIFLKLEVLGIPLYSREALVKFISLMPDWQNLYFHLFHFYFNNTKETINNPSSQIQINEQAVNTLAKTMRKHFAAIFFSNEDAMSYLEKYFDLSLCKKNVLPNAAARPDLGDMDSLRQILSPNFRWDYELLLRINKPSPYQDSMNGLRIPEKLISN